jgi:GMP synthase (glutamine-hydrolysing)
MRALLIIHQSDSGPGVFYDSLSAAGVEQIVWFPAEEPAPPGAARDFDAVLSFGGAVHPVQDAEHPWLTVEKRFLAEGLEQDVPMFGVCLGSQLIAEAAGSHTRRAARPEIGWYEVRRTAAAADDPVFGPLAESFEALQWHSYEAPLPPGAVALAESDVCLQSYRIGDRVWAIQFHAEVTASDYQHWLDIYDTDPDAVAMGLDVDALAALARERMEAWNELGRGLSRRFLQVASQL